MALCLVSHCRTTSTPVHEGKAPRQPSPQTSDRQRKVALRGSLAGCLSLLAHPVSQSCGPGGPCHSPTAVQADIVWFLREESCV